MNKTPPVEVTVESGLRTALTQVTLNPPPQPVTAIQPETESRWSYSATRRLVQGILAAKNVLASTVRIWHRNGTDVRIGMQRGDKKIVLGRGSSFQEAFENVFINPLKVMDEALAAEEEKGR